MTFSKNNVVRFGTKSSFDAEAGELPTNPAELATFIQQAVAQALSTQQAADKKPKAHRKPKAKAGAEGQAANDEEVSLDIRFADRYRGLGEYASEGMIGSGELSTVVWHWDGSAWRLADKEWLGSKAQDFCREVQPAKASAPKADNMVRFFARELSKDITMAKMEKARGQRVILPVNGHYLELRDNAWHVQPVEKHLGLTHTLPDQLNETKVVAGIYQPQTELPEWSKWKQFLDLAIPNPETQSILAELMAASLLPICYQIAAALVGNGENGKSVLLDVLRAFHSNPEALSLGDIDGNAGLAPVVGASVLIEEEAPIYLPRNASTKIKQIITRNPISVRKLYKDPATVKPKAMLWISMNIKMASNDTSYGWTRRFVHIPMMKKIPKDKIILGFEREITDDPKQRECVLDWILQAAIRLVRRGKLPPLTREMLNFKEEAKAINDPVYAWLVDRELCTQDGAVREKRRVYQDFCDYQSQHGHKGLSDARFWDRLKALLLERGETLVQTRGPRHLNDRNVQVRDWLVNMTEKPDSDVAEAEQFKPDEPLPI